MRRRPFVSSVRTSSNRSSRLSSRCENISWEQATCLFRSHDTLDANGHRRRAMRDLMLFRASDHLAEGMLEDAEKFVGYFRFAPEKTLQTLHPLEVGNNHSAGVAENVWNDKDLIPALLKDQIRFRRGRTICGFGENAAVQFPRIFAIDDPIDRRWYEHVALHRQQFVRIDMIVLAKRAQVSFLEHVLFGCLHINSFWIVKRREGITDAGNFEAGLERER